MKGTSYSHRGHPELPLWDPKLKLVQKVSSTHALTTAQEWEVQLNLRLCTSHDCTPAEIHPLLSGSAEIHAVRVS